MIRRVAHRVLGTAAAAVDRAASLAAHVNSARSRANAVPIEHAERVALLERFADSYPEECAANFYCELCTVEPLQREVRREAAGTRVLDLSWPSTYAPFLGELSERYLRTRQNHVAAARFFTRGEGRPVVILIHGYMAGHFTVEERLWPIERLLDLGFDVVLFVLPFHSLRADPTRKGPPEFPGSDPRISNEGFRQAIFDLQNLMHWLRANGHQKIGLMGMSLGGYTASLAATIRSDLEFLVPVIPLASLADFALEQGQLSRGPEQSAREHELLERVYRVISPLHRAPKLPKERVLVVGAKADRITPVSHARRLAAHFGAPLVAWHGGHLLQLGRDACFRRIEEFVQGLQLT